MTEHLCYSIAGGETTAHSLSSAVYYLLKTPAALRTLQSEVRSHFKSFEEIDATAASQLPYLQAVIHEALRIHPSGAQGFPRISPGIVIDGKYIPAGVGYSCSNWRDLEADKHRPRYSRVLGL